MTRGWGMKRAARQRQIIVELYDYGNSIAAIAAVLAIDPNQVVRQLTSAGITVKGWSSVSSNISSVATIDVLAQLIRRRKLHGWSDTVRGDLSYSGIGRLCGVAEDTVRDIRDYAIKMGIL